MKTIALLLMPLLCAAAPPTPAPSPTPVPDPCGSILSIVTRPTVSTTVCTVRTNHVLLENGYTNTVTTGTGGGVTVNYPQSFLRIGTASPHLEIDFSPPSFQKSSLAGAIVSGQSDVAYGAKYEIGYSSNALWGVSALVSVPSGNAAFSAGAEQYTLSGNWSYTLSPAMSLFGALGFNSLAGTNGQGDVQRFFSFIPSAGIAATITPVNEFEAEYAYFSSTGPGLSGRSLIDAAYVHDFGPHWQADVEFGIYPTVLNGQKQHYAGFGLSYMN